MASKASFIVVTSRFLLVFAAVAGLAREARAAADESARQACRAALASHDPVKARDACRHAYVFNNQAEDMYNHVEALVATRQAPSMGEYVEATFKADLAVQVEPNAPWGYAARCLVALRIGDRDMLDLCLADLRRVAPDHELTKRTLETVSHRDSVLARLGRWLLILAFAGTLVHAALNRRRRGGGAAVSTPPGPLVGICAFVLSVLLTSATPSTAHAEARPKGPGLSGVQIDENNPAASIPPFDEQMKNPLQFGYIMQDMLGYAQEATKRGDFEVAARYYLALANAVPTRAFAYGKLCEIHDHLGNRDRALEFCKAALSREGVTMTDYDRTVGLLLAGPLTRDDRAELGAITQHIESEKDESVAAQQLRCRIALALNDVRTLESCTASLTKAARLDAATLTYRWALALARRDFAVAQEVVGIAQRAGLPPEAVAKMQDGISQQRRQWRMRLGLWTVAGAMVLALLVVAVRRYGLPRRRLAT